MTSHKIDLTPLIPASPQNHSSVLIQSQAEECELKVITDEPLWPLNKSEILKLSKTMFISSLPTSLSCLSTLITGMVCLGYIGNYGSPSELAGASIASTWSFVFYFGIINCINIGFQVIASQFFGAGKHQELAQSFHKTVYIILILSVPLLVLLFIMNKLLNMSEEDTEASVSSEVYLKYSIPSLICSCISDCIKGYLMAQNYFYAQGIIPGAMTVIHFFLCHLFVVTFDMPLTGAAIAKNITDIGTVLLFFAYMHSNGILKETVRYWDKSCLREWAKFLKQASTIGANAYLQWVVYGIWGFYINYLQDEYVMGAHGLAATVAGVLFTIPLGNSVTMQTYLGNAAGGGWKNRAQKVIFVGLGLNLFFTLANIVLMGLGNEFFADLLTSDEQTKEIFMNMMNICLIAHFLETFSDHFAGILRTLNFSKDVIIISSVCYFLIGTPLQWILGIEFGYGYMGMWGSIVIQDVFLFGLFLKKFMEIEWPKTISQIKTMLQNLEAHNGNDIELEKRVLSN